MKSEFLTAALRLFSHQCIFSHLNDEITMLCELLSVFFRDEEGSSLLKQASWGSAWR